MKNIEQSNVQTDGDHMLKTLSALANPHRLRILSALSTKGRNYVSQLARDVGISRPLLHLHLQKLEEAGLVTNEYEVSADGKALKFFSVTDFKLTLTPASLAEAARSLGDQNAKTQTTPSK